MSSGNVPVEYRKDETSGLLTRCKSAVHGWLVVTPETDKELATFKTALDAVTKAAESPTFPQEIRDKLPTAYKALGFSNTPAQQRG
jgi:hypothetical protein